MSHLMNNSPYAAQIAELETHAIAEGITLPFPAVIIAALEAKGFVVDLQTGLLSPNGANTRVYPTTVGEAQLFVANLNGGIA